MTSLRNVWVFGGTGFIGQTLLTHLSELAGIRLNLLVHNHVEYNNLECYNVFTGSIQHFNLNWFKRYPPFLIFHLARLAGSSNISRYIRSQIGASANRRLLNFLSSQNLRPVIVYVSGSLMYGSQPPGKFADENSALFPVSYAKYYYYGELPLIEAQNKRLADIRFARPGWIIGPDSWFRAYYWNTYLKTGKIPLYGDGNQLMSITDIDNCAIQIINLAEKGKPFQNLNVFDCKPISQLYFCNILSRILNAEIIKVSRIKFRYKYGGTAADAFSSSIPMTTVYPELHAYDRTHGSVPDTLIEKVVSVLKHEKGIFTESPQKSLI